MSDVAQDPPADRPDWAQPDQGPDQGPAPGSLGDRLAERQDYLEQHQTGWFGVPGYDDLVEVELRALGFKTIRTIQKRQQKVRDENTRELYAVADQLVTATVGFREVLDEGQYRDLPDEDWVRLARRLRNCPEAPSPRQALLFVVGDKRLLAFAAEFEKWAGTVRKDVDEEVVRDFASTR